MKPVYLFLYVSILLGSVSCGEEAPSEKMPVKTELADTGNIQDGTEIDKTVDIDTTVTE